MFLGSICIRVRGTHLSEMPCRSTCAIDDPTQIPEIKMHRPGRQDRADCLQRQAWDIRSAGKLSPGACQAPNESHLCPLIGVLSRELFAPILPAAYLNSQIAQIATSGAFGRCCRRDLRRRCASENIAFPQRWETTSKDGAQDQDEEAGRPNAPAEAWLLLWRTVSCWTTPLPHCDHKACDNC